MRCPRCRSDTRAGIRFCEECGERLALTCVACGAEILPDKRFCGSCGSPVGADPPTDHDAARQRYARKHVAEDVLIPSADLEGQRKQVTVLFADVRASMELMADRDPEEARRLIQPILAGMMEAVHRYEGIVNQAMGDGIMALFGAPFAQEEHALRACCAALRMQAFVKQHADEVLRAHGFPIQIRVGLNSGEVVVGTIGSDWRVDYTAVGQTTHLAARMEQMATPGVILLTPATLELAEGYIDVRPLGPIPVKGLTKPLEVYELVGAAARHSRLHAAAARELTRFVGRDTELRELRRSLERAAAGRGQLVAVVGEAGVGKSRLYWEFTRHHRPQDWLVLDGGSASFHQATSYLPVITLLKSYFQIEDGDDARKIREKVEGKVMSLDRALEPTLPALLALLDVPIEDAEWHLLDPRERRQRTLNGVKHLLLRQSRAQPLLIILEDLHWFDRESQALLESLVESLPAARVLLLVNYRTEYKHGWSGKSYYAQIGIAPLPAETADDLLAGLLGTDVSLESLKRTLIERTGGNPLFLEESVRALVETRALIGERGDYRLAPTQQTVQVPATVQAILAARIDRLSSEDRRVLQAASVIGRHVPLNLLQLITELSPEQLRAVLTRLQGAEFLYEARMFPDLEYTFKHVLTQEVAYGGLLHEQRRALHARIMAGIEALYPDHRGEQIERLAQHASRGGAWDKAAIYGRQAGVKAFARSAYREAVGWFEQSLHALENLPQTRENLQRGIDLRFDLRNALLPLGEHARYFSHLKLAEASALALDDQERLGSVAAYICAYLYLMGDQDGALDSGQRALAIAEKLGDFRMKVRVTTWLGQAHYYRGEYREATRFFQQNVDVLVGELSRERFGLPQFPSVHSRTCLVWCLAELGEFAEGVRIGEEGLEIARSVDHPLTLMIAYVGLGTLFLRQGEATTAIALLEPALELCRAWDVPLWFTRVASSLGSAYALAGRTAEAIGLLRDAVGNGAAMGLMGGHSRVVGGLAEALLPTGDMTEVRQLADRALALAREHGERGYQAWALRLLGELAVRTGDLAVDDAIRNCQVALEISGELGMRPLMAHVRMVLGRCYQSKNQHVAAREHLSAAVALFREMGMRLWAEQAGAELASL